EWVEENQLVTICDGDKDKYQFGFNGQEKVNEWAGVGNYVDFGARGVDTRVARLGYSVDPLMKKFPSQSPYVYAGNSPIYSIDVDGTFQLTKNDAKNYPTLAKYLQSGIIQV